jgi:O-antigen/teichoic acid export membrane protein
MKTSTENASSVSLLSTSKRSLPLLLGLLCAQAVAAGMMIVSARVLGPMNYGTAMAVVGVGTFATALVDFGGAAFSTRELAQSPGREKNFQKLLGARLSLAGISILLGVAFWWIVSPSAYSLFGFVLPIATTNSIEQFSLAPLRAALLNGRVAFVLVLEKLFGFVFVCACFIIGDLTAPELITALCLGSAVGTAAAIVLNRYSGVIPRDLPLRLRLALPWRGTSHLGISTVANGAQFLDAQVIQMVAGPVAAGQYAAVARWNAPLGMVSTALTQSLFPVMAVSQTHRQAWRHARNSMWILMLPGSGLVLLAAFASPIVNLTLGEAYEGSVGVVRVLALGLLAALVNQPISGFLQARGRERSTAKILVVGVSAQLGLMTVLSYINGAVGAGLAFALAQTAILGMFGISVWHILKHEESSI